MGTIRTLAGERSLGRFRAWLRDPDPQVRLNAAVRLAYLGRADGVDELIAALTHPEGAIRLVQVPEALALLGEEGLAPARRLIREPGPGMLAAARALIMANETDGVVEAVRVAIRDPDPLTRQQAASTAGELGPVAAAAADALRLALDEFGEGMRVALPALASVSGPRVLPILLEYLEGPTSSTRVAALRGLAGLGLRASGAYDRVASRLDDTQLPLRERLAAAQALTRISPTGRSAARALIRALPTADRWFGVGVIRALAQLLPGYPRRPERSDEWPLWESRFILSSRPRRVDDPAPVLAVLAESLQHEHHDVRRNAALALAFVRGHDRGVLELVRSARLVPEGLRRDLLHLFRADSRREPLAGLDPDAWPWELTMVEPKIDLNSFTKDCERQWRSTMGGSPYRIAVPKVTFLRYLVARHRVLLHGSSRSDIEVLMPRSRSWGGGRTSGQPGVFAVDHASMAMYFAIVDRERVPSMSNGIERFARPDGRVETTFNLGVEFIALAGSPFKDATVYILPPDTFTKMGEMTSLVPVRPHGRIAISPADFPLLEYLWGRDLGPLSFQFGDRFPFLRDTGVWATKRSDRSAASQDASIEANDGPTHGQDPEGSNRHFPEL